MIISFLYIEHNFELAPSDSMLELYLNEYFTEKCENC